MWCVFEYILLVRMSYKIRGGGQNFERPNVDRPIFRNLKITNVESYERSNYSGEGKNFEKQNFRMANVSYLKINERSNIERPILRE